uniref:E3 ubiquitin-protein ligase RNF170 n=1 Tax=Loa loa TaxID=7209 RepID=A0A1I7VWP3_LOALO
MFTFLCALIGVVCFAYCRQERQERNIHPTLESAVAEFRRAFSGGTQTEESQSGTNGNSPRALRRFGDDRTCPICFGQASFAVVTNCGHLFCCSCIYGYWQYSASLITPVKCAVCRETVNLLIPLPVEGERESSADEALRCDERLTDYNRRFSNERRPIIDYIRDLPILVPYMFRAAVSVNGLMFMFRIRVFLCLFGMAIYILSPFDILPEAAFGVLGMVDDIFIAFVVLVYATILFRQLLAGGRLRFGGNAGGGNDLFVKIILFRPEYKIPKKISRRRNQLEFEIRGILRKDGHYIFP